MATEEEIALRTKKATLDGPTEPQQRDSSIRLTVPLSLLMCWGVGIEGGSREKGEGSEEVNYNISALLILVAVVENCEQGWGEYAWKHCALVGE